MRPEPSKPKPAKTFSVATQENHGRPEPSKSKPAKTFLVDKEENHGHLIIKRSLCFQVPHEILKHISTRQSQTMPPRLYIVLVSGCCCSESTDEIKHRFSAEGSGQGFSQTAWSCSTLCLLLVSSARTSGPKPFAAPAQAASILSSVAPALFEVGGASRRTRIVQDRTQGPLSAEPHECIQAHKKNIHAYAHKGKEVH